MTVPTHDAGCEKDHLLELNAERYLVAFVVYLVIDGQL
jgi:hypothetical protein